MRPRRRRVGTAVALALLALVLLAVGAFAAEWLEARAEENAEFMCSFGTLPGEDGVPVRDHPVGEVCQYFGRDGRLRRVVPMVCVEEMLEFEPRGGALLAVRKTPSGFRCVYHDGGGHILRVRHVEEQ